MADTATVQYETDREEVERLLKIQRLDSGHFRELLDEMLEIIEVTTRTDDPVTVDMMERVTRSDDLGEEIDGWAREQDIRTRSMTRMDVFAYLGIVEKREYGYIAVQ